MCALGGQGHRNKAQLVPTLLLVASAGGTLHKETRNSPSIAYLSTGTLDFVLNAYSALNHSSVSTE